MRVKNQKISNDGFTIIELLIATLLFAAAMVVAQVGFLTVGQLFYKGEAVIQTQTSAHQILDDLTNTIQHANSFSFNQTGNGYSYACIGGSRYIYNIDQLVDLTITPDYSASGNFGLIKDNLPGSDACAAPCVSSCPTGYPITSPTEFLNSNMRIDQFDISQLNAASEPNLYTIKLIVTYGKDDFLAYTNPADKSTVYCQGGLKTQQYCSVYNLSTNVYEGLHP